jgi:hypothetical protein
MFWPKLLYSSFLAVSNIIREYHRDLDFGEEWCLGWATLAVTPTAYVTA